MAEENHRKWLDPATIIQTLLFLAAGVPAAFHMFEKVDASAEKVDSVVLQVQKINDTMETHTTAIGETGLKIDAQRLQINDLTASNRDTAKALSDLEKNVGILLDRSNKAAGDH